MTRPARRSGPCRSPPAGGLPCCPNAWSRPVGHFASRAQRRGRPHERGRVTSRWWSWWASTPG